MLMRSFLCYFCDIAALQAVPGSRVLLQRCHVIFNSMLAFLSIPAASAFSGLISRRRVTRTGGVSTSVSLGKHVAL